MLQDQFSELTMFGDDFGSFYTNWFENKGKSDDYLGPSHVR